ncbi:hypothetical protein OSTOST_04022 [Ostertagia ostertagi]
MGLMCTTSNATANFMNGLNFIFLCIIAFIIGCSGHHQANHGIFRRQAVTLNEVDDVTFPYHSPLRYPLHDPVPALIFVYSESQDPDIRDVHRHEIEDLAPSPTPTQPFYPPTSPPPSSFLRQDTDMQGAHFRQFEEADFMEPTPTSPLYPPPSPPPPPFLVWQDPNAQGADFHQFGESDSSPTPSAPLYPPPSSSPLLR